MKGGEKKKKKGHTLTQLSRSTSFCPQPEAHLRRGTRFSFYLKKSTFLNRHNWYFINLLPTFTPPHTFFALHFRQLYTPFPNHYVSFSLLFPITYHHIVNAFCQGALTTSDFLKVNKPPHIITHLYCIIKSKTFGTL